MKNIISKTVITLLAVFYLSSMLNLSVLFAQTPPAPDQIWSFQEGDKNKKKPIKIDTKRYTLPIVDINSVLTININTDVLRGKAAEELGEGSKEAMKKMLPVMDEIKGILEIESDFMKSIRIEPGDNESTIKGKIVTFQAIMKRINNVAKNPETPIGKLVENTYMKALSDPRILDVKTPDHEKAALTVELYSGLFTALANEIKTFSGKLRVATGGVTFRMGGWLEQGGTTQPIHIEGFDEYAPGQYTRIPFLTKQTPEEFAAKMEDVRKAAQRANQVPAVPSRCTLTSHHSPPVKLWTIDLKLVELPVE